MSCRMFRSSNPNGLYCVFCTTEEHYIILVVRLGIYSNTEEKASELEEPMSEVCSAAAIQSKAVPRERTIKRVIFESWTYMYYVGLPS